jgi:hypothetical protein
MHFLAGFGDCQSNSANFFVPCLDYLNLHAPIDSTA